MGCSASKARRAAPRNVIVRPQAANTQHNAGEYDILLKVLIIGDAGVGKTSLLLKYTEDKFDGEEKSSIGVDFRVKTLEVDGQRVRTQIWDTAGQERFRTITSSYYRGGHIVLLAFDTTNRRSFERVSAWSSEVDRYASELITRALVGTKTDQISRIVSPDEAQALAQELDIPYFETSAKTGEGIDFLFLSMTMLAKDQQYDE